MKKWQQLFLKGSLIGTVLALIVAVAIGSSLAITRVQVLKELNTTRFDLKQAKKQADGLRKRNFALRKELKSLVLEHRDLTKLFRRRIRSQEEVNEQRRILASIEQHLLTGCLPRKKNCQPILRLADCRTERIQGHPYYTCPIVE